MVSWREKLFFDSPEETCHLLVFIGAAGRYKIKAMYTKNKEIAAVTSTQRLALIAGHYVGKDDSVCIVHCTGLFPGVGEVFEPFTMPHIVEGWMRGSHYGPLRPVPIRYAAPGRFNGPPRVIALGFKLSGGYLIGPRDMFDAPGINEARNLTNIIATNLPRHGLFEHHRLPMDEMEYITLSEVMDKLKERWQVLPEQINHYKIYLYIRNSMGYLRRF